MTVRFNNRAGHLWVHDHSDRADHAMPRHDVIKACRYHSGQCRARLWTPGLACHLHRHAVREGVPGLRARRVRTAVATAATVRSRVMGEHITGDGTVYDYSTGQRIGTVDDGTIVLDGRMVGGYSGDHRRHGDSTPAHRLGIDCAGEGTPRHTASLSRLSAAAASLPADRCSSLRVQSGPPWRRAPTPDRDGSPGLPSQPHRKDHE
jgi:hypothetical protein